MPHYDSEIAELLEQGLITPDEAQQFQRLGRVLKMSPKDLLHESEDRLNALLAQTVLPPNPRTAAVSGRADLVQTAIPCRSEHQKPGRGPDLGKWSRYQLWELLGRGGMGKVYRAYDPQLKRQVAIKVLDGREPEWAARFVREARAQARVDHPNIASIFEVGEWQEQPYIVMQLIKGSMFHEASVEMTLEQKILVLKQAAEGMHEAHRSGLVHRDIKPANIMVERDESGNYTPYVLDFGLAFFETDHELTVDGALLGTPMYMAPEQVRGELDKLDRRTDVYGLGVTLYQVLTGHPPFQAKSRATLLMDILEKEPEKPRHLAPELPADVETILLKCLARERDQRYQSARALADDLGRFLDGEPIAARPAGWWYLLSKKLHKYRTTVAVTVTALVLLILAVGWGLWRTATRTKLTANLFEQVNAIEALARYSHMSPPHDIRPDRQKMERKMKTIEEEMTRSGAMGKGPGNYALGWGLLQSGQTAAAIDHLETAWQAGYQDSRAAYALGLAYTTTYHNQLLQLSTIEDGPLQEKTREQLQVRFRDPALDYMREVEITETASPAYLQAIVALLEERYPQALIHLEAVGQDLPWFYEAHKLKGHLFLAWSRKSYQSGNTSEAREMVTQALQSYEAAAAIAPSDPQIPNARANALVEIMAMNIFEAPSLEPLLEQGLSRVEEAIRLFPENGESLLAASRLYRHMARQDELFNRKDPRPLLKKAVAAATAAMPGDSSSEAALELGCSHHLWANWLATRKQDPSAAVDAGLEALEKAEWQDARVHIFKGKLHKVKANWLRRSGGDACDAMALASTAYEKALSLEPHNANIHLKQAITLYQQSFFVNCPGPSAQALLTAMMRHLNEAEQLRPGYWQHFYYKGFALRRQAQGFDDQLFYLNPDLAEKAISAFQTALELNPEQAIARRLTIYNEMGSIRKAQAMQLVLSGGLPEPLFAQAMEHYQQALSFAPNHPILLENLAWVFYDWGKCLVRRGVSGEDLLLTAMDVSQEALSHGRSIQALLCLGSAWRIRGEWAYLQGQDPSDFLRNAWAAFEEIMDINLQFTESHRSMGRLYTLLARSQRRAGGNPKHSFHLAHNALNQALECNPVLPLNLMAAAHLHLHESLWLKDKGQDQARQGLELVDQVLAIRPDLFEAQALKAFLVYSQIAASSNSQGLEQARSNLKQMISNKSMGHQWASLLEETIY